MPVLLEAVFAVYCFSDSLPLFSQLIVLVLYIYIVVVVVVIIIIIIIIIIIYHAYIGILALVGGHQGVWKGVGTLSRIANRNN